MAHVNSRFYNSPAAATTAPDPMALLTTVRFHTTVAQQQQLPRDGPAEVWRYRATECFLELFIYRDADNSQREAHVDARNFAGRPASADMCLTRLVAEKRG